LDEITSIHYRAPVDSSLEPLNDPPERVADFWSFVDLATSRLDDEYGLHHNLATRVLLTLNRASELVTYDLESAVHRRRGGGWSRFRLMFVVWLAGPLEPSAVARLTGMSRASVSNLVKTLETEGLVERQPGGQDGRTVHLTLTRAGRTEMRAVFGQHNARELTWVSVLSEEEQQILVMLLNKLITRRSASTATRRNQAFRRGPESS
jgi:DNA-binding MarR family transcriptional regulator